jgi:hypothetical protein
MAIKLIYPTKKHMHTYAIPWILYSAIILEVGHYSKTSDRSFTVPCKYYDTQMMMIFIHHHGGQSVGGQTLINSSNPTTYIHTSITNEWWNVERSSKKQWLIDWMVQFMYTCWWEKRRSIHSFLNMTRTWDSLQKCVSDVHINEWLSGEWEQKTKLKLGGEFCRG